MSNPYSDLPDRAFWRSGVVQGDRAQWSDLFRPAFKIGKRKGIATAGSCFAQHIRKALASEDIDVLDCEVPPEGFSEQLARRYGYGLHSGRYGNIYTPRQLRQLLEDAAEARVHEALIWEKDGRYYDALRPNVEPQGCDSPQEVMELRRDHLINVGGLFSMTDVLIFTMGLTESWVHKETGYVLPVAPGVIAGTYEPSEYDFKNFSFWAIKQDVEAILKLLKQYNPKAKLLLTVSPVPLTATATDEHVLLATNTSKSILRAVAAEMSRLFEAIDYFPSYEIVTTPTRLTPAFEPNLRSIRADVVQEVMGCFLDAYNLRSKPRAPVLAAAEPMEPTPDELVCEEVLIEGLRS